MNKTLKEEIKTIIRDLGLNCNVREFKNKVDWGYISIHQKLSESFIREFKNEVNWYRISTYQKLSNSFIREFKDKVDWGYISIHKKLSNSFIKEFKDKVDWYCISEYQKLSESVIREFKNEVNWYRISKYQKLSKSVIREFKNKVSWICISTYQKLSESFIKEFEDKVNWGCISKYQKLSESFIIEFKDKVGWYCISKYQKLSESFIKEFKDEVYINLSKDNWLNRDTKFKKEQVIKTNKYKCYKDYFIAFKSVRSDRYSKFNFQYRYLNKQSYKCFSDGSDNENSFGLSVWTKEQAYEYCDECVLKVKVYYKDVTRVVHNDNKIRCKEIYIMNEEVRKR